MYRSYAFTFIFCTLFIIGVISPCCAKEIQTQAIIPINQHHVKNDVVRLGEFLYNETLFSKNLSNSCNTCHTIRKGGVDNLPRYKGMGGKIGLLNTPTVLNASLNFRQFWDGRADNLYSVIDDHVKDETVFANNWGTIVQRFKDDENYRTLFNKLYGDGVTNENIKNALVFYINYLQTPNSPFDRYLNGDKTAISDDAKKGYKLFNDYGCITCHQGNNIGGNLYQRLGIYTDYFSNKKQITQADLGLFNITAKENDKYVFKVPSLRNIALTYPYYHDGSVPTLEEAVKMMGIYQVGQSIPDYEVESIVKFLQTLTGVNPVLNK